MEINPLDLLKNKEVVETPFDVFLASIADHKGNRIEDLITDFNLKQFIESNVLNEETHPLIAEAIVTHLLITDEEVAELNEIFDPESFNELDELTKKLDSCSVQTEADSEEELKMQIEAEAENNKEKVEKQKEKTKDEYWEWVYEEYSRNEIRQDIKFYDYYLNKSKYGTKEHEYFSSIIGHLRIALEAI